MKKIYLSIMFFALCMANSFGQLADGTIAPDWTLTDIEGNEHTLSDYTNNGYTVILDFSATWCGPCWNYHNSGALEDLYINHGPAGMPNVSPNTTDDVMVFMVEGDGATTLDDLNGTGASTIGDWVTGTPYPIIDSDEITSTYSINFWPTIYTVCLDQTIQLSGQRPAVDHYNLAYDCAIASLDVQAETTSAAAVQDGAEGNATVFTTELFNSNEMTDEILSISYTTDAPSDWSAEISSGSMTGNTFEITATALAASEFSLSVNPGATAALANYTMLIASVTYPTNPVIEIDYFVAKGITDLVVDNKGVSTPMNVDFTNGLDAAGNTSYAVLDIDRFTEAIMADQLSEVGHVYYNIGWTFPSLTDAKAEALAKFMDEGGNLMIAGQDLAWDTFNNEGTPNTQAFFTEYLSAQHVSDGSGANNQLTWVTDDEVFGSNDGSPVVDIYGGNIYPEEINPIAPAVPIYYYGTNESKVGGIRVEKNGYKMVYLGVDIAMIGDEDARNEAVQVAHDWFRGIVNGAEEEAILTKALGQSYPNPTADYANISFTDLDQDVELSLVNLTGQVVFSTEIAQGTTNYRLDVRTLPNGVYSYVLTNQQGDKSSKLLEVIR